MDFDQFGSLIKEYRERYKVSQEDLAFDLCAVSTLSNIEKGEEVPGIELLNQLLSRLGLKAPAMSALQPKEAFDRAMIEMEVADKEFRRDFDTRLMLDDYEKLGEMNKIESQWYHYHRGLSLIYNEKNPAEGVRELKSALDCSLHSYKKDYLPNRKILSSMEALILYEYALALYDTGKKSEATELAEFLDDYIEHAFANEFDLSEYRPELLRHLAQWKLEAGDAAFALEASEKGIEACTCYGKLFPLPHLVQTRGKSLQILGRSEEAQKALGDAGMIFKVMESQQESQA